MNPEIELRPFFRVSGNSTLWCNAWSVIDQSFRLVTKVFVWVVSLLFKR